ncbi:butyrophilin subfamily 1 member A1 isoform X1 [Ictalurus punctatus]|uniref:Butyrophilin subfamily 1 member A1 isoform X1 n=2 Tax=Ictalurus punctatus TaxID=7998 RepID=A0A2D0RC24_ICTPU|nr:butyrophilin subfamily 1 member A1 isoform X1 [Ictalurus punctatus]
MFFCVTLMILYRFMESQAAQGTHPVIMMESYDHSGGIDLVCESKGWNLEPEVLWLNRDGDTLPAKDTQIHKDTEGFSVKRHITVYDYSDSNKFYCRLLQGHHMMEAEIIINSKVFDTWKWAVAISVLACLIAVGWILTAVILHKTEPQRQKVKRDLTEKKNFVELQRQRMKCELAEKKKFAVDVTLDPDKAHPELRVSPDGKQVMAGDQWQDRPDTPQRFADYVDVVGKRSFSSRRFYYEVQVSGKTKWNLGVVRENINRKEKITWRPQDGFWTVKLRNENEYCACAGPDVLLTLREKVEKVGVFVDYEEGLVSFYDVKSNSHIYSFTAQSFTDKLYPYFCPDLNERSENSAPLIISPVLTTE